MKPYYQSQSLDQGPPFWYSGRWVFAKGVLLVTCVGAFAGAAYLLLQQTANDDRNTRAWGGSVSRYSSGQRPDAVSEPRSIPPDLAASAPLNDARQTPVDTPPEAASRDGALHAAELCAAQGAWGCVLRRASEALAVDAGNQRAQSLLQHAIVATAWKPLDLPKPGSPKLARAAAPSGAAVPWSRGGTAVPLPSSLDWDADQTAASKRNRPFARPPLPGAKSVATGESAAVSAGTGAGTGAGTSATAGAKADAGSTNVAVANPETPPAATTTAPPADVAAPAASDSAADPQQRAIEQILQSGWKQPTPSDATH